ncbi:ribosome small subunit-dependent GTPase A [Loigolactobacillus zhaoyuanensis]|uniref:Small ribosomal subunit biogenesis GTPase RsgA n=1 Tax=Loigolactobacillus zhaoyuanensis TaxID=2486017 RepID=A0ABW8UCW3_9LACO|nr:ribosome small subunit-dependent GTPase A [Loigolactobacillus zhaoyuanensis]
MLNFPTEQQPTARIIFQSHDHYQVIFNDRSVHQATLTGRLQIGDDLPVIGDFVSGQLYDQDKFLITALLPRQTLLTRSSGQQKQVVAANITTVFVTMSLNADFSVSRVERYLTLAWDSGASPVIVLTKADLEPDLLAARQLELAEIAFGVPIITTTNTDPTAIKAELLAYLTPTTTAIFVGSSGVGKSTLLNIVAMQQLQATKASRANDGKGRHTTTARHLYYLANGAALIDSPGLRGVGVASSTTTAATQNFPDITELARLCRFNDCQHRSEPGCAVQAAITAGSLNPKRLTDYHRLTREIEYATMNSRQITAAKIKRMVGNKKNLRRH